MVSFDIIKIASLLHQNRHTLFSAVDIERSEAYSHKNPEKTSVNSSESIFIALEHVKLILYWNSNAGSDVFSVQHSTNT